MFVLCLCYVCIIVYANRKLDSKDLLVLFQIKIYSTITCIFIKISVKKKKISCT